MTTTIERAFELMTLVIDNNKSHLDHMIDKATYYQQDTDSFATYIETYFSRHLTTSEGTLRGDVQTELLREMLDMLDWEALATYYTRKAYEGK